MIVGGLILGAGIGETGIGFLVAVAGLISLGIGTVFSFITLPVEQDTSNRKLASLHNKNIVYKEDFAHSRGSLKQAARTYLFAALGFLAMLLHSELQIFDGRD